MGARRKAGKGKVRGGFDTFETAMMLRAIALMFKSGVPLVDGLAATISGGFPGPVLEALKRTLAGLKGGKGFAESLKEAGFPRLIVHVCAAGEETGHLDRALGLLADELVRRLRDRDGKDLGGQARQMIHLLALTTSLGLPLLYGVEIAADNSSHAGLGSALLKVRDELKAGAKFADALARHPEMFGPYFIAYMRVGESTGTLDTVMERMAGFIDELLELQRFKGKMRIG